jgi:hypothetical protein
MDPEFDFSEYEIINKKIDSYTTNTCIICSNLTCPIESIKNFTHDLNKVYCTVCFHLQLDTKFNKFNYKFKQISQLLKKVVLEKDVLIISPVNVLKNKCTLNKESLSLINKKFDVIIIVNTFEYTDTPIKLLNDCKKFMNNDTTIYIQIKIDNSNQTSFFNVNTMINITSKCKLLLNFLYTDNDYSIYEIKNLEFKSTNSNIMESLLHELKNNVYKYIKV